MSKKMSMDEYNSMTNVDKVNYLNKYQGKSKQFQAENEFSWTYATSHCNYVKDGKIFVAKEEELVVDVLSGEDDWTIIKNYRGCRNVAKSFRLPDEFLKKLKEYAKENKMKESEVVLCAVEKYINTKE